MKKILNLFPILTFFASYKFYDIFTASKFLIVISFLVFALYWLIYKKVDKISFFNFITISIFGSLTIFFHDTQFIKWKITIVYILFSIVLLISQFFTKKSIIQRFLEKNIKINNVYWNKINFFWALFFLFCSILNIYIAFWLPEKTWVNFKVFGILILMFFALIATSIYINFKVIKKK